MRLLLLAGLCVCAGAAWAHDGVNHATPDEARAHLAETAPLAAPTALPFDVGGPFDLIDDTGAQRTQADPDGRYQLLFFGYANCPSICAVAMPLMADVTRAVQAQGVAVRPVMITVDAARDTVGSMSAPLSELHPDFVGLTGAPEALQQAYDAYRVDIKHVFDDPQYGPVYAHGSHIYLLDGKGKMLTILPPILDAERAAQIVANYALNG